MTVMTHPTGGFLQGASGPTYRTSKFQGNELGESTGVDFDIFGWL